MSNLKAGYVLAGVVLLVVGMCLCLYGLTNKWVQQFGLFYTNTYSVWAEEIRQASIVAVGGILLLVTGGITLVYGAISSVKRK